MTARLALDAPPLRVQRLSLAESLKLADGGRTPFGGLGYGTPESLAWMPGVDARVLSGGGPMADVWLAGEHIESGITGAVRWRSDGHWMLGAIELEEAFEHVPNLALSEIRNKDGIYESIKEFLGRGR